MRHLGEPLVLLRTKGTSIAKGRKHLSHFHTNTYGIAMADRTMYLEILTM
jgi:hypothetical protein